MRIVSLLPSATEIICALGLRERLVGVSHVCDWPADVVGLPTVTRTLIPEDVAGREIDAAVREHVQLGKALYRLDAAVLEALRPDLIVTQTLCDVCAVAESEVQAAVRGLPTTPRVVNLAPHTLHDMLQCIRQVGEAAGANQEAGRVVGELRLRIGQVAERTRKVRDRPRTVLLEWIDPPFCAGHWSPELVSLAGGREAIGAAGRKSEAVSWSQIRAADPEVMLIACCGWDCERALQELPTLRGYDGWSSLECVKAGRVYLVDGSAYFNRPGPRLVDSLEILAHALHPAIHPLPAGLPAADAIEFHP